MDKQECVSPSPSSVLALILIAHNKVQHSDLYEILLSKVLYVALIAFWAYFLTTTPDSRVVVYISTPLNVYQPLPLSSQKIGVNSYDSWSPTHQQPALLTSTVCSMGVGSLRGCFADPCHRCRQHTQIYPGGGWRSRKHIPGHS